MDKKEPKTETATGKDIEHVLDTLHDHKHYIIKSVDSLKETQTALERRVTTLETYAKVLMGGVSITIVGIAGLAFWFGSLKITVSNASTKTDKIYEVVLESKDSLNTRTGVLENKLDTLDKKVTDVVIPLMPKDRSQLRVLVAPRTHHTTRKHHKRSP